MRRDESAGILITQAAFAILAIAAWLTHIVVAIMAKAWLFMIVGALLGPVAVAHGVSVWLGYDWLH